MTSEVPEPIAVASDPNGPVAEAYRSLRVSLVKQLVLGRKVCAFVSAWPGDGKSMVCTNTAIALAQLHQKVLLIDGDLRRPTISRVFSAHKMAGIADDLDSLPETINLGYETQYPNAWVLPRGLSEKNPADLLAPDRLAKVFRSLRESYDVIIVDTPPLSACSDALLFGSQADGAVMVISPKGWDGEVELRFKQQLEDHAIPVWGAVLNGARGSESHGYGYGYAQNYGGTYGNYGSADAKRTRPAKKKSPLGAKWMRPDED